MKAQIGTNGDEGRIRQRARAEGLIQAVLRRTKLVVPRGTTALVLGLSLGGQGKPWTIGMRESHTTLNYFPLILRGLNIAGRHYS